MILRHISFIKIDNREKLIDLLWQSPVLFGAVIVPDGAFYSASLVSTQLH